QRHTKGNMMNRIDVPIAQLSFTQKLDLMEMLWADMAGNEKELESPVWHGEILNERVAAMNAGKVTVSSWEEAKERIKKNVA
ncbi:MAG: addiction module protein, partial [Gallionellaceae bacterium]|nr:addiction module protein [Gallionellaceae bacterium]